MHLDCVASRLSYEARSSTDECERDWLRWLVPPQEFKSCGSAAATHFGRFDSDASLSPESLRRNSKPGFDGMPVGSRSDGHRCREIIYRTALAAAPLASLAVHRSSRFTRTLLSVDPSRRLAAGGDGHCVDMSGPFDAGPQTAVPQRGRMQLSWQGTRVAIVCSWGRGSRFRGSRSENR